MYQNPVYAKFDLPRLSIGRIKYFLMALENMCLIDYLLVRKKFFGSIVTSHAKARPNDDESNIPTARSSVACKVVFTERSS
jgi:hypothetical protein